MPLSSSLDVVLENDDLVVIGGPSSIDIALDIGPQGTRGSKIFTNSASPTTLSLDNFNTIFGYTPISGDVYISTQGGSNYGTFYMYSGSVWNTVLTIADLVDTFFISYPSYVVPAANGGTGANNTGASLNLGLNAISILGSYPLTLNFSAATNITFPTSGTLATTGNLSQFASTTSAQLAGIISDETGTGALVFSNSPTFTTPDIGSATGTSLSLTGSTLLLNSAEAGSPSSNASFKVERGTSPDVEIRWNESTGAWQFTNDGTTYTDIGSGGGGGVTNTEDVIGISFFTMGA